MEIIRTSSMRDSLGSARPPFLLLTPACLLLALGAVAHLQATIEPTKLMLVLLAGLSAHVSVNAFNEYFDFKSGLDLVTEKTAFSGGSGTLPRFPEQAPNVLTMAIVSLLVCIAAGFYLSFISTFKLLLPGTLGVMLIVFYTTHITRIPWLCLIAPGLAFGPIMTMGVALIFIKEFSLQLTLISLVPFFLVNNLLLLNQLPDIEADKTVGRKHFPIVIGRAASLNIFAAFNVASFVVVVLIYLLGYFHWSILLALIPLILAFYYSAQLVQKPLDNELLNRVMPLNVVVNLTTPSIIGVALWVST